MVGNWMKTIHDRINAFSSLLFWHRQLRRLHHFQGTCAQVSVSSQDGGCRVYTSFKTYENIDFFGLRILKIGWKFFWNTIPNLICELKIPDGWYRFRFDGRFAQEWFLSLFLIHEIPSVFSPKYLGFVELSKGFSIKRHSDLWPFSQRTD